GHFERWIRLELEIEVSACANVLRALVGHVARELRQGPHARSGSPPLLPQQADRDRAHRNRDTYRCERDHDQQFVHSRSPSARFVANEDSCDASKSAPWLSALGFTMSHLPFPVRPVLFQRPVGGSKAWLSAQLELHRHFHD